MNALNFKDLFYSYGYGEYRLSGFEEYSLYAGNKNFLPSKEVITFSVGKKLLALRPDVTLSIVKNISVKGTQKLFYDERVFRPNEYGGFSELSQIGVEVIGEVDAAAEAEVLILLKKCLQKTGLNFVVDISHAGIAFCLADMLNLEKEQRQFALKCLYGKNEHDFVSFAGERIKEKNFRSFLKLISLPSGPDGALAALKEIIPRSAEGMLENLESVLKLSGKENIRINFSASGDENYYNGLIFSGFLEGIPRAVAYGGRYDKLLKSFAKEGGAIGFALYMGDIEAAVKRDLPAPEIAVVYNKSSAENAIKICEKLRGEGKRVLMTRRPVDGTRTVCAEDI